MKAHVRVFAAMTSVGLALCGASGALAAPSALSDRQLDAVTAGGVAVVVSADAGAVGNMTLGGTTTTATAIGGASPDQPGLTSGAGLADGVAIAVGTNFGLPGGPPSTSTSVQTDGAATGNMVIKSTVNSTMHGPGGVTMTVGWTYVFGMWMPL